MANFVVVIHSSQLVIGWAPFFQNKARPIEDLEIADCAMLCVNCGGQKNS